jgi:hypothetical protein
VQIRSWPRQEAMYVKVDAVKSRALGRGDNLTAGGGGRRAGPGWDIMRGIQQPNVRGKVDGDERRYFCFIERSSGLRSDCRLGRWRAKDGRERLRTSTCTLLRQGGEM